VSQLPAYEPESWDAQVGQRIKTLLIGRATQTQLGTMLGLGQTDISKRLRGSVAWKGRELADIAAALGVSIAVLYGEPTSPAPNDEKAPTPKGEGLSLPELDSNQQPAGDETAASTLAPVTPLPVRAPSEDADGDATIIAFPAVG